VQVPSEVSQMAETEELDLISGSEEINSRIDTFIVEAQKNFDAQTAVGVEFLKNEDEYKLCL